MHRYLSIFCLWLEQQLKKKKKANKNFILVLATLETFIKKS